MTKDLRVLLVEDSEDDANLIRRTLERGGYVVAMRRVDTGDAMRSALAEQPWDVVISDHAMPRFSAPEALAILAQSGLDLPFILVSGAIGEDMAVTAMKAGAHDFVLKGNLSRLVPVVDREHREAANRSSHRQAERDLREAQERYRRLFDGDPTGAVLATNSGRILECNPAFLRMFHFQSRESALASSIQDRLRDAAVSRGFLARIQHEGRFVDFEAEWTRCDGVPLQALASVSTELAANGGRAHLLVYVTDITRRKELEALVRQAQKMEVVGRLAAGVAHDFNNLLTVISGYSELMLARDSLDERGRNCLEQVKEAGERGARLTRQLLALSRKQVLHPGRLDLQAVLSGMESMLRRLLGESVELEMPPGPKAGPVVMDRGMVEQIVMNLAVNARDAMPSGGRLTIRTGEVGAATEAAIDLDLPPGRYACITVADQGTGMDMHTQTHLFEPFFTTKEPGRGTGLGLSMVYGIVTQSGGHIRFTSGPGTGTTFRVYFPVVEAVDTSPASPSTVSPPVTSAIKGGETILVAEDDPDIRSLVCAVMREQGYVVLETSNGEEAVALSHSHIGDIHLLLTDVVMPKLGGRQAMDRVVARRPATKVLFLSGYPDDMVGQHGVRSDEVAYLEKPFSPQALVRKVREVLDAGAAW